MTWTVLCHQIIEEKSLHSVVLIVKQNVLNRSKKNTGKFVMVPVEKQFFEGRMSLVIKMQTMIIIRIILCLKNLLFIR